MPGEVVAALEAGEDVTVREAYRALEDAGAYECMAVDERMLVYRHVQEETAAVIDLGAHLVDVMHGDVERRVDTLLEARKEAEEVYLGTVVQEPEGRTATIPDQPDSDNDEQYDTTTVLDIPPGDVAMVKDRFSSYAAMEEVETAGDRARYRVTDAPGLDITVEMGTVLVTESADEPGGTLPPSLFTGMRPFAVMFQDQDENEYWFEWETVPGPLQQAYNEFTSLEPRTWQTPER